ncbi:MAG: GNAT family N-acetyltransferase [Hyphomicrobiales bacterium]|nr:GNAT family N-acetyltransferase [Hyphomicrobiales bacterium]
MTELVIDIRFAATGDAAALAGVYERSWREAYAGMLPALALNRMIAQRGALWWSSALRHRSDILVLDIDAAIAGYASLSRARIGGGGMVGEVRELYLDPLYQGIGFGAQLFGAARQVLNSRGNDRVIVTALEENHRAIAFYRQCGGRLLGRGKTTFGGEPFATRSFVWTQ